MKSLWVIIVLAVAGATVATLVATSGDDGAPTRSIEAPASTWAPDIAPPGGEDDKEQSEQAEAEPPETSEPSLRPVSFRPTGTPSAQEDDAGRRPRGSSIDVTEGEFAESSEGEDELEAELEEEEAEAKAEEEEDEEKAERREDRNRNRDDD